MTWDPIYIVACLAVVMNILASIYIITRQGLERFQIVGQIVLVWVFPVRGRYWHFLVIQKSRQAQAPCW